jgi:polar amino acid transport system substrate-binding protein
MRVHHALILTALLPWACGLPRDPDDTLQRVEGGKLRVGVAIHPPWTVDSAGSFGGVEPALVRAFARELNAEVVWMSGGESVLLPRLHQRKLDIVVAGLDDTTPWGKSVGMTRPYHWVKDPEERALVWAVAPGENRFQMRVEHFLRGQRQHVAELAARASWEGSR